MSWLSGDTPGWAAFWTLIHIIAPFCGLWFGYDLGKRRAFRAQRVTHQRLTISFSRAPVCQQCGCQNAPHPDDRCSACGTDCWAVAEAQATEYLRPTTSSGGPRMAEVPFDTWYAVWQIQQECEGHRFGEPDYDMTLDHIYELASGVLADFANPSHSDSPIVRDGVLYSDESGTP